MPLRACLLLLVLGNTGCGYQLVAASTQELRFRIDAPSSLAWTRLGLAQCLERDGGPLGRPWRAAQLEVDTVIELLACEQQPLGIELLSDGSQTPRPLAVSTRFRCLARVSSASSTVLLEGNTMRREHELVPLAKPLDEQSQEQVLAQLCEQTLFWRWQLATEQP